MGVFSQISSGFIYKLLKFILSEDWDGEIPSRIQLFGIFDTIAPYRALLSLPLSA